MSMGMHRGLQLAGNLFRRLTPLSLRLRLHRQVQWLHLRLAKNALKRPRHLRSGPLIVSGYLNEPFGIGRAGDLTAFGLEEAGFQIERHSLRSLLECQTGSMNLDRVFGKGGVWILHCNPAEALAAFNRLHPSQWRDRYRIGYWAYELPTAPEFWLKAASLFDEIWTPSQFVADSLSGVSTPVKVMPHFVQEMNEDSRDIRKRLGVSQEGFLVVASADLRSSLDRKNLLGAISIFQRAAEDLDRDISLIVKLSGVEVDPEALEKIRKHVDGNDRITIIVEPLSAIEMRALCSEWDLFLSPHHSEGFGLVIAESMMAGSLVLATGWSGNMQYMSDLPELCIDFKLTAVKDTSGFYRFQTADMWAEPDEDDAVNKLVRLATDAEYAERMRIKARESIAVSNSCWTAGILEKEKWVAYLSR